MTEEILIAGSTAKMAELAAKENLQYTRKQKQPDPRASRLYAQRRSRFKTHAGQSG